LSGAKAGISRGNPLLPHSAFPATHESVLDGIADGGL